MTLVVSAFFSISIVVVVYVIEEHLISETLDRELDALLKRDIKESSKLNLPLGLQFYTTENKIISLPDEFREAKEGFSEIVNKNEAFYVYTKTIRNNRYMLVQDQNDFEAHEKTLHRVVVASFLCSVVIAWFLGWIVARRAIYPLVHLSEQVRKSSANNPFNTNLANEYPNDEVGELAAAFDEAMNKIVLLLRREQLFASDVSHELRTPLMIIASSSELLRASTLNERQGEQVKRITRAAEDMHGLVKTFLILARSKFDRFDTNPAKTLEAVADEQINHWAPLIKEKGLTLSVKKNSLDSKTYDETLLNTVMMNLLRNAVHYTEQGEIQLLLEAGSFQVKDSGIGISSEDKKEIFSPFFRASNTRGEGVGLGLSLVQRICAHQGWVVEVEDTVDAGCTFTVTLKASST
jgi:signal transduction histidine kinase